MNMKHIYLLACLLLPVIGLAQEKPHPCGDAKRKHHQAKSNTLDLSQIAETERYDVHYYFLDLNLTNLSTDLSGVVEIHASARENLDSALFELFEDFTINSIEVNGLPVAYNRVNSAIKVPTNALTGESFVIRIDYEGTPPTADTNPLGGGGMTNDNSPSWGNQVTWSLSEAFVAYEWFPVKQSLRDKADSSRVHMTIPTACKGGSNGVLENVVDLGNGTHRFEWRNNRAIDYYLISVAVAEYVEYIVTANPSNSGPVTIQNYIYNNPATLPNFQDDIDETADFIELFAELYGPYPFADQKYGHCMAPIGGGMEHQTMTTQGSFSAGLTSHELGHQWWGDNVTCASWADIWVNEGFASYSEQLMLENLYPGQNTQNMLEIHQSVMEQPNGSVWVEDSLNTNRIFSGRLTYDKGAAIIHTMRFLIDDDEAFFDGLRAYQTQFTDSTAIGLDVKEVMETTTGVDLTNFFQEWYFGEGFPTYSARWNMYNGALLLEITQTTSANLVTPFFTNDLEIKFDRPGATDTIIRFPITGTNNQFVVLNPGNIINLMSIDPNNWIINRNGTILHDLNMADISETELADQVRIYPNPSNGPFTVEMPVAGDYTVTVLDTRGRVMATTTFTQSTVIDLGIAASGSYLIQISAVDGTKVHRIVKK